MLRWSHFILFTLAMIESYCNMPSKFTDQASEFDTEQSAADSEQEKFKEQMKLYHRDGSWKLFSRILSSISVFVYQGAVFNA